MNPLFTFQNDSTQREAVKEFMIEVLKEIAVEKTFAGEPVLGIQEARLLIERTFDKLDELHGKIEKPVINNPR